MQHLHARFDKLVADKEPVWGVLSWMILKPSLTTLTLARRPRNRSRLGQKRGGGLLREMGGDGGYEVHKCRTVLQAAGFTHRQHAFHEAAA